MAVEPPREALCCSQRGGRYVPALGGVTRKFRSLPIGGKPMRLRMTVARVLCRTCFLERQVSVGFADPKKPSPDGMGHAAVRQIRDRAGIE